MTVKERLKQYAKAKKISIREFERLSGLNYGYVNAIRVSIQPDKIEGITSHFNDLDIDWLLTGKGNMFKSNIDNSAKALNSIEFMEVTLVPISAAAGYPHGYGDQEYIESLPTIPVIVDKTYKGKYRIFEVNGDSMDDGTRDSICDKDKVLCREVKKELWKSKLHIRDWYFVIVHKTEGVTIKQITNHDVETGNIICHPTNPLFSDFTLNLDEVVELYNVIKIVDRNTRI